MSIVLQSSISPSPSIMSTFVFELNWSLFLNFGALDPQPLVFALAHQPYLWVRLGTNSPARSPLEGAIYATSGGVFTLVLLIAQVMSISTFNTNRFDKCTLKG